MSRDNEQFGVATGGYKLIEPIKFTLKLDKSGLNVEEHVRNLPDAQSPDMSNIRLVKGGIAPEFALQLFPIADVPQGAASAILNIVSFEQKSGSKKIVRMLYNRWEWFNGANWVVIPGSVSGVEGRRLYSTVMDDKLIGANGHARLQQWNGQAATAVADLSAEAPAAKFVTRIGQRLFVANAKYNLVEDLDPYLVGWSADGDMLEWTDAPSGAGSVPIRPEGTSAAANYITGLSSLERGTIIYRQRSLVLVGRTGVRAAPFRFTTIDFAHGTESPYAIANGGLKIGDFFLGYDFVVYHFDGQNPPVPVGLPIQARLETRITDLEHCVGFINPITMEYCLLSPTEESTTGLILKDMHIFSIKDYLKEQRLVWRYRPLNLANFTVGNYVPRVPSNTAPVVDTFTSVADRVDPTDSATHIASSTFVDDPTPPPPTGDRMTFGSFFASNETALVGFDDAGNPNSPTPDTIYSSSNGSAHVRTLANGGYIEIARANDYRLTTRIVGGNNDQLMVNAPTDRRYSLARHNALIDTFVTAVINTQGGLARLQAGVKDRIYEGFENFDDIRTAGTHGNLFSSIPTFADVELSCKYIKVTKGWNWMPCWARVPNTYLKTLAAANKPLRDSLGNSVPDEWTIVNGYRQFKYLDGGWAQARPIFRNSDIDHDTIKTATQYYLENVTDGLAVDLACRGGLNLWQGSGNNPPSFKINPRTNTVTTGPDFGTSTTEIDEYCEAAIANVAIFGIMFWKEYSDGHDFWARTDIQTKLEEMRVLSAARANGPRNVRSAPYDLPDP